MVFRQYELVERVRTYNLQTDEALLNKAYVFAMRAHGTQKRANGDPYFSHPIEVAAILTDLKLDDTSIITALLHDTLEDTAVTREDIRRHFGDEVASLVDGVTKLSKLELKDRYGDGSDSLKQAENFRKLMMAVAEDLRVLLVKLADRLHNMRTLGHIAKPEKRRRIAQETIELYAPLAGRIGLLKIHEEMEDLAFAQINPEARSSIVARLEEMRLRDKEIVNNIEMFLIDKMREHHIDVMIKGRVKSPFSIFKKMERKVMNFEQLTDVIGFRLLVDNLETCYRALGIVHQAWPCVPGRFKDYISMPKRNGYRSIHTAIVMSGRKVEVQIRTKDMHEVAERGVAAHWSYKQGAGTPKNDPARYAWVREILEAVGDSGNPLDLIEHTKMEIYHDQVFCFTPKGRIIGLPRGATPIDFAYAVHTNVGNTCVGAKINGLRVPVRTRIQNGDTIDILCSDAQTPSPAWEAFAVTGRAKTAIRRFRRQRDREQYIKLGRVLFERMLEQHRLECTPKLLEQAAITLKFRQEDELYAQLGQGALDPKTLLETVFPDLDKSSIKPLVIDPLEDENTVPDVILPMNGVFPGMGLYVCHDCYPLPGDRIIGIIELGKGVRIHTADCGHLANYENNLELWLDLHWNNRGEGETNLSLYKAAICVDIYNKTGGLGAVTTMIGRNDGNILNCYVTERKIELLRFCIEMEVRDVRHLQNILKALRSLTQVGEVERIHFLKKD